MMATSALLGHCHQRDDGACAGTGDSDMLGLVRRLFGLKQPKHAQTRRSATHGVLVTRNSAGFPIVKPAALDLLDNKALEIHKPDDNGFDPYNTGMFNRSGSWERINKRRSS